MEDEDSGLLAKMLRNYSILSQALVDNQLTEKHQVFEECLQGAKGGWPSRKLTVQIVAKFYKHFPDLQQEALDCVLDLCEVPESQTRMFAIKFLPMIGKENPKDLLHVAYLLSQLLQLGLPDYNMVCDSLGHVFKLDPLIALKGMFKNISEIEEGPLRDKTLDYIYTKLTKISVANNQQKVDELLLSKARNMIQDCSTEEFMTLMVYMLNTKWQGQQELFQIIEDKIEMHKSFHIEDIDRLDICVELILPLFDQNGDSSRFVIYYCQKVLPKLQEMLSLENGDQYQIELLKQLTLMSPYCKKISVEALDCLLESLKEFIPVLSVNDECPNLQLCHVECLLYTFHNLCKILPEFLLNDLDKLNNLRTILQYLTFVISDWNQTLKMSRYANLKKSLSQIDKIRLDLSLKIFDNLLEISKDFFPQPPVYEASVQLSFTVIKTKVEVQEKPAPKRVSPITFDLVDATFQKPLRVAGALNQPNFGGRGGGNRGRGIRGRGNRGKRGRGGNWGQRGFGRGQNSSWMN